MIWKLLHIFSMSAFSLEDSENGFWGFACFQLWFAVDNDWNCALISLTIPKELCSFNCLSVSLLLPVCWNSWHSWLLSLLMLPLMLLILRLSLAENFSEQSHLGWESLLSLTSAKFSWKQFPPITGEKELVLLFSNWLYSGSRERRAVYFSILKGSRSQIPCVATDNSVRFSHLNSGEWLLHLNLCLSFLCSWIIQRQVSCGRFLYVSRPSQLNLLCLFFFNLAIQIINIFYWSTHQCPQL